jgi:lipopolysaccharide-induced tumor necrosis factor-alpha factor
MTGLFGWVPYVMDNLKDAEHRCGSCGALLAKWHRNGGVVQVD